MKVIKLYTNGVALAEDLSIPLKESIISSVGGLYQIIYRPARIKQPYCLIVNEGYPLRLMPVNIVASFLAGIEKDPFPLCGTVIVSKTMGGKLYELTKAEAKELRWTAERLYEMLREDPNGKSTTDL